MPTDQITRIPSNFVLTASVTQLHPPLVHFPPCNRDHVAAR